MMRKIFFILVILFLAVLLANCSQPMPDVRQQMLGAASFSMQVVTPAPPVEDHSEIGSTDGILIMGIVIVAIASLPILLRRKKK